MVTLTEDQFRARRASLMNAVAGARTAHEEASLKFETESGSHDEVVNARAAIAELEDRVLGLDAAWTRAQADARAQDEIERRQSVAEAVAVVDASLVARVDAAQRINDAVNTLRVAIAAYESASKAITSAATSTNGMLSSTAVANITSAVNLTASREHAAIANLLWQAGLRFEGLEQFQFRETAFLPYIGQLNRHIGGLMLSAASGKLPAEDDELEDA